MATITIPTIGQYGVIKDQPSHELPINAWSDAVNMRFRENAAERFKGEKSPFDTPAVTPYWITQYNAGTSRWWIHAGLSAIYADNGSSRSTITPSSAPTGGIDDRWSGGVLNGILVANNGIDVPITWNGSGVMLNLTAWPSDLRAAVVKPFKNFVVAVDITKNVGTTDDRYPHMIKWSSPAVPGALPDSYDETDTTKLSGELEIAEDPSLMVDMLPLADSMIIYKEASMWSMTTTGDQEVFRVQRLPGSVGALARGCVANTDVGHVVLTPGDVILHNGQGVKSIITGVMRRWIFNQIDSTNRKRSFVVTNPPASEVWVCFPELGSEACTLAAVWNWLTGAWSIRTLNNVTYGAVGQIDYSVLSTWAASGDTWNDAVTAWNQDELSPAQLRLLTTHTAPDIRAVDVSATFAGTVFTSYLERTGLSFDDTNTVKLMRSVTPRIDAAAGTQVQIQIGGVNDVEKPVEWSDPVTYTVGSSVRAYSFASGKYLAIRFQSLDNQPFLLRSYDVDVQKMGTE